MQSCEKRHLGALEPDLRVGLPVSSAVWVLAVQILAVFRFRFGFVMPVHSRRLSGTWLHRYSIVMLGATGQDCGKSARPNSSCVCRLPKGCPVRDFFGFFLVQPCWLSRIWL